ncbi:MAG: O-antigen ligase family protein [bacterium]
MVVTFFKSWEKPDKYILLGLFIFFVFFGFADLTTYLGLLLMLMGGILVLKKYSLEIMKNEVIIPLLLLFLLSILSLFNVTNYSKAFSAIGSILEIIIPFLITYYLLIKKGSYISRWLFYFMITGSSIITIVAMYEYFILNVDRVESLVGNANILGVYMLFVIPHLIINTFYANEVKYKLLFASLSFIHFLALIFSGSRSAFLGVLLSAFVLFYIKEKKMILVFLIVVVLLPLFGSVILYDRLLNTYENFLEGNREQRFYIWKNAIEMFRNNPIFGVGAGQFPIYYKVYEHSLSRRIFTHAHNIYLQIAAEYGLLGIGIIVWLKYIIIKLTSFNFQKLKKSKYALAIFASLIAFMFQGLFEFSLTDAGGITILFGIILGWYIGLIRDSEIESKFNI